MAKFDLEKTAEVVRLCAVPHDQRSPAWEEAFFAAIDDASMVASSPQVTTGPDGFPYFVLSTPTPGPMTPFCITHILDHCLQNGYGAVINPQNGRPDYVFTYGHLLSYKLYGAFVKMDDLTPRPQGNAEEISRTPQGSVTKTAVEEERQVITAQPSEEFLPSYTRAVLRDFIRQRLGIAEPQMCLVMDIAASPVRGLIFNIYPEDFEKEEQLSYALYMLSWFMPKTHGVIAVNKGAFEGALKPI